MTTFQRLKKGVLFLLTLTGGAAVLYAAAAIALHVIRNHAPDSLTELMSPDRRYRIVMTEELIGFPGASCIKQVYVLPARATFDRNDEDNEVFAGACEGLTGIRWNGGRIQGTVALGPAIEGVKALKLKRYGANGSVRLSWSAH